MPTKDLISVVVPCFNEQEVLPATHARLAAVMQAMEGFDYEIVYVDDGSRDETGEMLRQLQASDGHVRVLFLSRNFGHQMASTAGLDAAEGDAVVLIDADLQDPPELIPEMVARWKEGYDVVYGQRRRREGETAFKLFTAKVFYRLFHRLAAIDMPLDTGDFRLMDRRVVQAVRRLRERDRFLRGMVSWMGFRQTAVLYRRAPRAAGQSKYPVWKMLRFALDGIFSFSVLPLRLATVLGAGVLGAATVALLYALVAWVSTGQWVGGGAALVMAMLLLGGVQLLCLGVIGEYVGRIYGEAKQRPLYLLRERLGFPEQRVAGADVPARSGYQDAA